MGSNNKKKDITLSATYKWTKKQRTAASVMAIVFPLIFLFINHTSLILDGK